MFQLVQTWKQLNLASSLEFPCITRVPAFLLLGYLGYRAHVPSYIRVRLPALSITCPHSHCHFKKSYHMGFVFSLSFYFPSSVLETAREKSWPRSAFKNGNTLGLRFCEAHCLEWAFTCSFHSVLSASSVIRVFLAARTIRAFHT